jgi:hypothetical protein
MMAGMTIAVSVRTDSAVIFATDSKLTSQGLAGFLPDGSPNFVNQTYDNATKVVHDQRKRIMALTVGAVNVGRSTSVDLIASYFFPDCSDAAAEEREIIAMLDFMNEQKRAHWTQTKTPPDQWPGPTMLIALAAQTAPRIWRVTMDKERYTHKELTDGPGIRFEGSYDEVISLTYGYRADVLASVANELGVSDMAKVSAALTKLKVLRPIDKLHLSLSAIPLQDAIDLAVFLASVQIEMDRFLPGEPACGGPIDVMVLRMVPAPEILSYPGKFLHHPHRQGKM